MKQRYPVCMHSDVDCYPHSTYDDVIALPYYGAKTVKFCLFSVGSAGADGAVVPFGKVVENQALISEEHCFICTLSSRCLFLSQNHVNHKTCTNNST